MFRTGNKRKRKLKKKKKKATKIAFERSWMHFLIFTFLRDTFISAYKEVSSVFRLSCSNKFKQSIFTFMISQMTIFLTVCISVCARLNQNNCCSILKTKLIV